MRLLLIEDSEKLQFYLCDGLRKVGYEIDVVGEGKQGLWFAKNNEYDVIILDIMLPGIDGLSILSELRIARIDTAVLILTAREGVPDRVKGLRLGADDYLTKPFAFDELVARLQALTRRRYHIHDSIITIRGLAIATMSKTVSRGGTKIELTSREYSLLEFLSLRKDRVLSRAEIEAYICDANSALSSNIVDAYIYALRRKIDVDGEPSIISTRRGMGYAIVTGESECPSEDD